MDKIIALLFISLACCGANAQTPSEQFVGAWELVSVEVKVEGGEWVQSFGRYGDDPIGYITYSSDGRMAVQICNLHRPIFDATESAQSTWIDRVNAASEDRLREALLGYTAYFGTYDIDLDDHSVTHNRMGHWIPNSVGSSVKRFYTFEGDLLILTPAESENRRLLWKHIL